MRIGSSQMPAAYLNSGATTLVGIPVIAVAAIAATALAGTTLRFLPFGRYMLAVGSNPAASQLVGLPTGWVVIAAFVASGGSPGLAAS